MAPEPITLEALSGRSLTPSALVRRRIEFFEASAADAPEAGVDELGEYRILIWKLSSGAVVGILDRPESKGAALLIEDGADLSGVLREFLPAFGMFDDDVLWRIGEEWPPGSW